VVPAIGTGGLACRMAKALGLDPERTEKFVIECEAGALVRLYVVGPVDEDAFRRLAEAVELHRADEVFVTDQCEVYARPAADPAQVVAGGGGA
jgi:hypothetical protein